MATYHTPGVFVEEISVFPPSVAEVGTAIPAFVGYTERAKQNNPSDLNLKATKIYSLTEYELLFGGPKADELSIELSSDGVSGFAALSVTVPETRFLLYYAVKMYFDNGGRQCYIVSVGEYTSAGVEKAKLIAGLQEIRLEDEPTLLVVPEAVKLDYAGYKEVVESALKQAGDLGDRFAILDAWGGDIGRDSDVVIGKNADASDRKVNIVVANREAWGTSLKYGAAYYPFLKTTINVFNQYSRESDVSVKIGADAAVKLDTLVASNKTAAYNAAKRELLKYFVTMPPSGAVAGVYAATDGARGVWKAPANVPLAGVLEPVVKLSDTMQAGLNVDPDTGKSINALRAFAGKGTLIWGARTLAGNDNEWRYVSVRRFFNMVEESVKKSTSWAVFEPNDANTWVKLRGMISNYLIDKWRDGALAGATPKEAFFVRCGLGTTMNSQDILQGRMNVEIGMAVVRPAEFIVLKFSHLLQTS